MNKLLKNPLFDFGVRTVNVVLFLVLFLFWTWCSAQGQQPQTKNPADAGQSLQGINAKWTNGVAPGYYPTCNSSTCATLVIHIGPGTCFDTTMTRHTYAGGTLTMTASNTNYIFLTQAGCALSQNTTGYGTTNIPIATVVAGSSTITNRTDDRTPFVPNGGGGGGTTTITTYFGPQDCTTDQTGNNAYTTATMTNFFDAHWEFVFAQASEIYCKVRIPHAVAGTPNAQIVLEIRDSDSSGHTANFKTCDNVITSAASYDVGALTCAANQTYTTAGTSYGRVTLTYNVQSTVAADNILVIGIATSTTGTAPTGNMLVDVYFKVDQTL